jgi:hypothetical protein
MIEVEWRVTLTRLGIVLSLVQLELDWIVNLRPDRALREKRRIVGWEERAEGRQKLPPPRL